MLDKFINKDTVTPEQIDMAYSKLKEYCDENGHDLIPFIKDESNIPLAAEKIQAKLPFAMKMFIKPKHLEEAIRENLDFIIQIATERHQAENPTSTPKTKTKKA